MTAAGHYLCFDFGMKQIGVAVGNTLTQEARPLAVLPATQGKPRWEDVEMLLKEWQPEAIIVGNPLDEDGTATELSLKAERFARQVTGRFGTSTLLHDERFSSKEAKIRAKELGHKGDYIKNPIDDLAAAIILESWLTR